MTSFVHRPIAELQMQFASGRSPVSLVEDCLRRIEESNAEYRAMIYVGQQEALADARQAEGELRSGRRRSALHGIPIVVKDVIDVCGWPTTAGSRLFPDCVAAKDAACVTHLRDAGAILLGKTNLHELTAGGHDNPWFGKVVNPLDPTRGTGGTSSGSAAAVSAGYCVAAIGTDTGGSNRSTAAATGLVGLKPTYGAIDCAGVRPTARSFDAIGPIASCVEDARLVHYAMQGDAAPAHRESRLSGLRIGIFPDLTDAEVDPAVAQAHDRWIHSALRAGASTCSLDFALADQVRDAGLTILSYELAAEYSALIEKNPERVGPSVREFVSHGTSIAEETYQAALTFRTRATREFLQLMSSVDCLATPVAPGLAPRLSDEMTKVGSNFVPYGLAGGRFRRWANFFGVPAIALPLPVSDDLPASIQISTPPDTENLLFSVCEALSSLSASSSSTQPS